MDATIHTLKTSKGAHTGTLEQIAAWQAEHQAACAEVDGHNVDDLDFDSENLEAAVRALTERLREEADRRRAREVACAIAAILRDPIPVELLAELLERSPAATIGDLADLLARARQLAPGPSATASATAAWLLDREWRPR